MPFTRDTAVAAYLTVLQEEGQHIAGLKVGSGKLPVVVSTTQPAPSETSEQPVQTPFADAASPFRRTEVPPSVFAGPPPATPLAPPVVSSWILYRTQINFGFAMLAFLMILVGAITLIQASPGASWRYYVAVAPAIPGAFALVVFVRALTRLDDIATRIQLAAFGLALGGTALATFGYAFFESVGLPHLSPAYVLPVMGILWGLATAFFSWRYKWRYRR